ncbi:MAG TPA: hypothetical protein PKO09_01210 [Anaerolineae bacterium]|nr:hypothetical protein [Anaerolineae bacterium]
MTEPERARNSEEKAEKQEKEREKQEKERGEKSWDEKWRRDPLNAVVWALILIWLGLALLANNLGLLKELPGPTDWEWSHLFFLGAGGILLLEVLFRLLVPAFRTPIVGTLVLGAVFFLIGLSAFGADVWVYALAVAAIFGGVLLAIRALVGKRE